MKQFDILSAACRISLMPVSHPEAGISIFVTILITTTRSAGGLL
ncbi:hypothetical protein [Dehalobacter sp. DCM]